MKRFLLFLALGLTMTLSADDTPVPANSDGWLHYDDGTYSGWSCNDRWAIVLPAQSHSGVLTKVKVFTREEEFYPSALTMTVLEGGNWPSQGTERYSQEVPLVSEMGWIEMTLTTPLLLDDNKNVWIVFDCPGSSNYCVAVSCNSPDYRATGSGSYVYLENHQSWASTTSPYLIRAYFEPWEFPENTIFSWDFEDGTGGWNGEEDNSKWLWDTGDGGPDMGSHSGTRNFKRVHVSNGDEDMLVSPELDLSNYENVELGFWRLQRYAGAELDELTIYYRPSEFANWMPLKYCDDNTEGWVLEDGIQLAYLSPTYQIGFKYIDGQSLGIALDDIFITGTQITGLEEVGHRTRDNGRKCCATAICI